jgi:hypothetical protein
MIWVDTITPGHPAWRALRAVRCRSVAGLRHHAVGQSRPWRPDRAGRLSHPAPGHDDGPVALYRRGDRHALHVRWATDCRNTCSTACWARTSCRRCLVTFGLSVVLQNALLARLLSRQPALSTGLAFHSLVASGGAQSRRHAAAHLRLGDRGDRWTEPAFLSHLSSGAPFGRPPTMRRRPA